MENDDLALQPMPTINFFPVARSQALLWYDLSRRRSSPEPASLSSTLRTGKVAICVIEAGGFICFHLYEKLMAENPHTVLAVDIYCDKIRHLVDPPFYGVCPDHLRLRECSQVQ
nr:UDP-D-apiose/UDP-D-xylose synthase-like [Aegilops tauschii subsp. strangulata]